jgi:hypothetical protein
VAGPARHVDGWPVQAKQPDDEITPAVMALLNNKQPVATTALEKVAANRYYRITLYGHLKKLDRLSLFTPKYATQKSIAESIMYQYASDDEDPSKLTFMGERAATYIGK